MAKNNFLLAALNALKFDEQNAKSIIYVLNALDQAKTSDDFREQAFKYAKFLGLQALDQQDKAYYDDTAQLYKGNDTFLAETTPVNDEHILQLRKLVKEKLKEMQDDHSTLLCANLDKEIKDAKIDDCVNDVDVISTAMNSSKDISRITETLKLQKEAVERAKKAYTEAKSRLGLLSGNREGKKEAIARAKALLDQEIVFQAEVTAAHRVVLEERDIARQQKIIAETAKKNIEEAGDKIQNGIPYDDELKQIDIIRKELALLKPALPKAKDAERRFNEFKKIALDPNNTSIQQARATTLIEKHGLMGFTDSLVRHGEKRPATTTSKEALTANHGKSTVFEGVRLKPGDTIHSTLKCDSGAEIRLIQDSDGHITDSSVHVHLKDEDKERAAIKMAKMLLLNYNPENGPIFISGGDKEQASRLYAALLLISQNNPEYQLNRADIQSTVYDFSSPGWFTTNKGFIEKHLPNLDKAAIKHEQDDLVAKQKEFKENYQDMGINIDDLPSTFQLKGKP